MKADSELVLLAQSGQSATERDRESDVGKLS